jgi:hypothetical protein
MAITAFVTSLKDFYSEGSLTPAIQEEYLNDNILDLKYLQYVTKERTTQHKLNDLVNSELGTIKFIRIPAVNEVTLKQFQDAYRFGVFPYVRGWIGYFDRALGLLLTREKLYEYILEDETKRDGE